MRGGMQISVKINCIYEMIVDFFSCRLKETILSSTGGFGDFMVSMIRLGSQGRQLLFNKIVLSKI